MPMDFLDQKVILVYIQQYNSIKSNFLIFVIGVYIKGKYSSNVQQDGNQNLTSSVDMNKKLEEITPLLHQATISSSNAIDQDVEQNGNINNSNNGSRNGSHKSNHRKRVKTKSGRKTAQLND